jgi:hypothetical protein
MAVERVDILAVEVGRDAREQRVELGRLDRSVVAPVNVGLAAGFADEKLVLGRAAGVFSGLDEQLAVDSQRRLVLAERMLVELRDAEVTENRPDAAQSQRRQMFLE